MTRWSWRWRISRPGGRGAAGPFPRARPVTYLGDPDLDGMSTLEEQIEGTDPMAWDSDGDGWWDGAASAEGLPVYAGATVHCAEEGKEVLVAGPAMGDWIELSVNGQSVHAYRGRWTEIPWGRTRVTLPEMPYGGGATVLVRGPQGKVDCWLKTAGDAGSTDEGADPDAP